MKYTLSLRERNRLTAMRLVQTTAVTMFEEAGFDNTTIESVSDLCGVSASTIYRHFRTKENVVLWDERDPIIDEQLGKRLGHETPVSAFRNAVVAALAERDDPDLFLRRLKLVYSESAVWGEAAKQDQINRLELAAAFASVTRRRRPNLQDEYVAAACLVALDIALDHWQREDGRPSLADLIDEAIHAATNLS